MSTNFVIVEHQQGTSEWRDWRHNGIGASDASTIMGENRFKTIGQLDTVGFVLAIGDDLNSADVYANHDLFLQLWDKLLNAAATEAVAESRLKATSYT